MILPTVISISEVSLLALSPLLKEGAFALGATHWQTIRSVLVPAAKSGIVASIILGMGRAVGKQWRLSWCWGTRSLCLILSSRRCAPSTNIGIEMGYASGEHQQALFATGIVLLVIIMILNSVAQYSIRRK